MAANRPQAGGGTSTPRVKRTVVQEPEADTLSNGTSNSTKDWIADKLAEANAEEDEDEDHDFLMRVKRREERKELRAQQVKAQAKARSRQVKATTQAKVDDLDNDLSGGGGSISFSDTASVLTMDVEVKEEDAEVNRA
jgi:hypothetical protein